MANRPMDLLVSVICPSIRPVMLERTLSLFKAQDYPNKELIILQGEGSIGEKRNACCADAKGDIIVHFDDDDYYAPDYISKSVQFLIDNKAEVTGLASAYFYSPNANKGYLWEYAGSERAMPYVCEATMCYYRRVWERRQFRNVQSGEGMYFLAHLPNIKAHKHINTFVAYLHGNNTASQNAVRTFKEIDVNIIKNILTL